MASNSINRNFDVYERHNLYKKIHHLATHGGGIIFFIDIDEFTAITYQYGDASKPQLLNHIASIISSTLDIEHFSTHLGLDQFVVILPTIPKNDALHYANMLIKKASNNLLLHDGALVRAISISIGISYISDPYTSGFDAITEANSAMYRAKAKGKKQACIYGDTEH